MVGEQAKNILEKFEPLNNPVELGKGNLVKSDYITARWKTGSIIFYLKSERKIMHFLS